MIIAITGILHSKGQPIILNGETKIDNGINRSGGTGVIIVSKPFSERKKSRQTHNKQDVKTYAIEPLFDKEES